MSNLLHKISDKLHGGSDKTEETSTRTDTNTGSLGTTDAQGLSSGRGATGTTGVSSSHGHHGVTTEEAPVVKERVHEHTDHVDKTKREDVHDKTNVIQTVQPIIDEQRDATRTRTEHHGTEVHEHGQGGIDERTARELHERREQIQGQQGTTVDHSESSHRERPDVRHTERTNTVEQVVPVVERDVYKPEVVEHKGKEVHVHHEGADFKGTRTAPAVTVDQYKHQAP